MSKANKLKEQKNLRTARGFMSYLILDEKHKIELANTPASEDTKIRLNIQDYIKKRISEGKSREDIIKRLNFSFGASKYAKYKPYYEAWVDNQLRKEQNKGEER